MDEEERCLTRHHRGFEDLVFVFVSCLGRDYEQGLVIAASLRQSVHHGPLSGLTYSEKNRCLDTVLCRVHKNETQPQTGSLSPVDRILGESASSEIRESAPEYAWADRLLIRISELNFTETSPRHSNHYKSERETNRSRRR